MPHKVGLTGKCVSRIYSHVTESIILLTVRFPELLCPVKSSTSKKNLGLQSFSKSLGASCYLRSCVYIYSDIQDYREDQSYDSTSGKQLTGYWGCSNSFPNNATHLFWDLYGCSVPSKTDLFPHLICWSSRSSGEAPCPCSVQCLGLHSSITMQMLINSPSRLCAMAAKPSSLPCTELFALLNFLSL